MAVQMKMRKSNLFFFLILIFLSFPVFSETNSKKWTIAAEEFTFVDSNKKDNVSKAISKTLPTLILEKLDANIIRNVFPDENFDRIQYDLKKERLSLFLQLSGLVKTKDSLILYDYSPSELKRKQKEQDKKIKEIKDKIDNNLEKLKKAEKEFELEAEKLSQDNFQQENDFAKFIDIVKHFFSSKDNLYSKEDLQFYNNDGLYTIPSSLEGKSYDSKEFENAMVNAKINTLLTGTITQISDYYSITVDLYLYPSGKKIASISDVGIAADFDLMCSNIARQLIPIISNSIPVEVFVNIQNEGIDLSTVDCFVDDILYKNFSDGIIVQSGVHYVQFVCPGYNSISTSYYFEGNKKYNIEVLLEKEEEKTLSIRLTKPISGLFYANGTVGVQDEWQKNKSEIKIDDKLILGNFISEFGENAFYYVPKNMIKEGENLSVNLKLYDKGDYVESRRKKMYFSYSLLMVSLIPTFITYGNYYNEARLFNNGFGNYFVAKDWETGYFVSVGISIGCGVLFAYELVRYLIAANQVIPKKARYTYNFELEKESLVLKDNVKRLQSGTLSDFGEKLDEKLLEEKSSISDGTVDINGEKIDNESDSETVVVLDEDVIEIEE